jgi:hypothetical protein
MVKEKEFKSEEEPSFQDVLFKKEWIDVRF